MESIRININKQLTREGLLPIISYPAEAAYDFRIHGCIQDMHELGANRAFELRVYPDGKNLQMSLIDTTEGGFMQYAILLDSSRVMVPASHLLMALRDLSKAYLSLAANDQKPSANKTFINAVADIRSKLALDTRPALPRLLPTPDSEQHTPLTYFMNFKSDGELASLLDYPDQEFFHHTASVYLLADGIQPTTSPSLRRVEAIVMLSTMGTQAANLVGSAMSSAESALKSIQRTSLASQGSGTISPLWRPMITWSYSNSQRPLSNSAR